ncbi:hypothetical protein A1QC_00040 [Vibrio rumoiensis 1S-45]|uniref:Uncharacterized protein n=2 Tax=Vibrio rumoiensis TaxID=76258 RepID=A0A1E5E6U6_9VIBR|nr:hypothetical protein A1QC_00040 [Vibrio rumoiensis 1S-45]
MNKNTQHSLFPRRTLLSLLVAASFTVSADDRVDTDEREELESTSTNIQVDAHGQQDNSRIYLKEGAIWAARDITRFDPVLNVDVADEAEVQDDALLDSVRFTVATNFSYYVNNWQLEIYQSEDNHLTKPLAIVKGDKLSNSTDIEWNGKTDSNYVFVSGRQLIYRLKAWDKDGNMDVTNIGAIDLVRPNKQVDIDKNESEDRTYGRAKLMRHNIPTYAGIAKFMGTGLYDVDSVTIGEDEFDVENGELYAEQFLPADAYLFPATVKFEDGTERKYSLYVRIPDTYWSQTGMADMYVGRNFVKGNTDALSVDEQYQGDVYNRGRLAYFGQGKFGDKLRITAQVDTKDSAIKDMFDHPFASDSDSIFDLVEGDDEMYYGTYGDGANITKVANTQGKVYLDVQYDKSQLLWGNYNTGITGTENSDYNRSLYGLKGDYRTRSTTSYGEDRLNIVGFAAEAGTLYSHDEFLGTGGSLYFLRHGEVSPGSDKVSIKVIDTTSNLTKQEITLESGRDYEIDEYQGRIILKRPLTDIVASNASEVIENSPGGSLENYLSVDYEYIPQGSEAIGDGSYGLRTKGWLNDYVGVGATYVKENRDNQDYDVTSGDITLRATEGTYLKAEFSTSDGQQANSNFVSVDGGLTFTEISSADERRQGDSLQIKGSASLYDIAPSMFGAVGNDISAWYSTKDAGYSSATQFDDLEQENYGSKLSLQFNDWLSFATRFSSSEESETDGTLVTDTDEIDVETEVMVTEHIAVTLAGKQISELNNSDSGDQGDGTLVGGKVEYIVDEDTNVYVKGQKTVKAENGYDDNDSVSVGAEVLLFEDLTVGGEYTTGDRGDAALASVNYDISSDYNTYLTYEMDDYEDQNTFTVGQKVNITSSVDFYQENQFVDENNGKGQIDSFGFDFDMTDDIEAGISYQQGDIDYRDEPSVERKAASVYSKFDFDKFYLSNKVEYRVDVSDTRVVQWVTTNRYNQNLSEEYTLYGKFNYSISTDQTIDETVERFIESGLGMAYRPIYNDDLNLLARYTYLVDYDATDRDVDYNDEESHIVETEAIYAWNAHIDIGAKFAYKHKHENYERESGSDFLVKNKIYLTGLSASYKVMKDWDVTGEYHWKVDSYYDQVEQGTVLSLNKHLGDNFKIGVGYNFSKFTDDLVYEDDYDAKGFFVNVIGKL